MIETGEFFSAKKKDYSEKTLQCIRAAMNKLEGLEDKPLMMLGKIQSGKTRSFIGLISIAFDNGYDLAIVLTKNSNALAKQTTARMRNEFSAFKDEDIVDVFDIMCMPQGMSKFELEKKLIIVVKKEKNNLPKLIKFVKDYSLDKHKKCLVIDDEADFCSIGYEKNKETEEFDLRKIASQINELRLKLTCRFVQVTATPYSLYLQPETIDLGKEAEIVPVKPLETVLVPSGDGYIGGDYYFDRQKYPIGEYLYQAIDAFELEIMRNSDRRRFKVEDVLTSNKISGLRDAIINFIVGGCIRIIQNGGVARGKKNKFSFIIHTQIAKSAHILQENIISELLNKLEEAVLNNDDLVDKYIEKSYNNLSLSIKAYRFILPELKDVKTFVKNAIREQWISKSIVNSENDINALLDDNGQLKLRTPFNIFIGGQILDRGITISNLIGFYYGRTPQKMQQDTVLQHSRMYGYRKLEDLAVTRFYTTKDLYERMSKINEYDTKLREDFEQGNFEKGVIFISKDIQGRIIPCSPQKISISNTQVLKSWKTITPIGFQTGYKTYIKNSILKIDNILKEYNHGILEGMYKISKEDACQIVSLIYSTIEVENKNCIDEKSFVSLINYLSHGYVNIYCGVNRNIRRLRKTSRYYSDMPYNIDNDLRKSKEMATKEPTLMLMKQNGKEELGWRGTEFYWPVLLTPKMVDTAVYTSEII